MTIFEKAATGPVAIVDYNTYLIINYLEKWFSNFSTLKTTKLIQTGPKLPPTTQLVSLILRTTDTEFLEFQF